MKKIKTEFKGLLVFENKNYKDSRGYLREIYKKSFLKKNLCFDYYSVSKKNVLRGMHFQKDKQQEKLITVIKGSINDFCLDLRKNSKTYLKTFKIFLSEKNGKSIFIPKGFAHGFHALSNENIVLYKNSQYRFQNKEIGINILDVKIFSKSKNKKYIISKRDNLNISLKKFMENK